MKILFFKRAIEDFRNNRLLNVVTLLTVSLSILIVSTFILFFINTNEVMNFWKKGLRLMAYLKADIPGSELLDLRRQIQTLSGVESVMFISKEDAYNQLKTRMKRQASLFDNLVKNPLPDAFEIRMSTATSSWDKVEFLATQIESLDEVEEVEYGQKWLGRFTQIFDLFTLTGYAMCIIFFMAAVFIMANSGRTLYQNPFLYSGPATGGARSLHRLGNPICGFLVDGIQYRTRIFSRAFYYPVSISPYFR
jgi:cell division transport system permease protein